MWEHSYFIYRHISVPLLFIFLLIVLIFLFLFGTGSLCSSVVSYSRSVCHSLPPKCWATILLKRKKKMNHIGHLFKILQSSHYSSNTLGLFWFMVTSRPGISGFASFFSPFLLLWKLCKHGRFLQSSCSLCKLAPLSRTLFLRCIEQAGPWSFFTSLRAFK